MEKFHIPDPEVRKKVKAIAVLLVASQVEKGELNPDDPEALKAATERACLDAITAYHAAEAFMCG